MGRAARRLAMAQPPLSQSIARLEKELGVRLFDRANRRIALTRAGAAMLDEARAAVSHADKAHDLARAASAGEAGEVRIGFVSAALYEHLPALLGRLRARHPHIRPILIELSTNDQLVALTRNEIDVGFVHPPLGTTSAVQMRELPREDLIAVVADDGTSGAVTLADIARRGLILFPAAQGPALHAQILDVFAAAGIDLPRRQEAVRALTMLSLVSAGLGAALLPRSTARVGFRGVRFTEIADGDDLPAMPMGVIARRRPRPPVIDTLLGLLDSPE